MESQRNPMVSRAAALEAAERLQQLTVLLDDGALKRILCEAKRTMDQHMIHCPAVNLSGDAGRGHGQTPIKRRNRQRLN